MTDAEEAEITAWFAERADKVIETACARVFLEDGLAFKIKRRVDLGYLDFTTEPKRRWALDRELAFNRPAAPDIYHAVRSVTREADGALALDGLGTRLEPVLEMRRFDDGAVLSAIPEAVDGDLADALGREVAAWHLRADIRLPGAGPDGLAFALRSNLQLLRELAPRLGEAAVEALAAASEAALEALTPLLASRADQGFVRRCHGDLHLGNILLENGRPVLFDCIEFNDRLSEIDVQYDLAFLLMDLDFRGRREAAVRVMSSYLDAAARGEGPGVWGGWAALPLMLSVRAAVRAHVAAHSGDDILAGRYLCAALDHLDPPAPRLAAVGGLSGTGKTTFARLAAPLLGPSPGAVVLRTDEVRKRLAGVGPGDPTPPGAYGAQAYAQVYVRLLDEARALLSAGRSVILDGTFLQPELRAQVEAVAREAGVAFEGVWLEAPADVLAPRIEGRRGDASEATAETLARQLTLDLGEVTWTRLDARGPSEAVVEAWARRRGSPRLAT